MKYQSYCGLIVVKGRNMLDFLKFVASKSVKPADEEEANMAASSKCEFSG